ncbi:tetratricopeptide repeat protein [Stenotrophomonas sp. MYb238]|uniref:tetratricopeptide repeat protein n=1 Tax=Stenotrophomonas sp. MYb238 TaxID=2040281 RepID=UPI0018851859|nr:tetratricopeptide repeat protein [Stenotrophomonas sp. MYb238]
MEYEALDDDELLHLSLEAINGARDADAMVLLKVLAGRSPGNPLAHYLLAAQHAQTGLLERAEQGFRRAVELAPEFTMARFQLGQLMLVKGDGMAAAHEFRLVRSDDPAIACYAEGLCALAEERQAEALASLGQGLALPQKIPALAQDMQQLADGIGVTALPEERQSDGVASLTVAPMLLSNYSRYN